MNEKPDLDQLTKILAVEMTARTNRIWRARIDPDRWVTQIYTDEAVINLTLTAIMRPIL